MKNKWIVWAAMTLIIVIVAIMVLDLFSDEPKKDQNVYEYQLDQFKKSDSAKVCYQETGEIKPSVKGIRSIGIDKQDQVYITANNLIIKYNQKGDSLFSFKITDTAFCIAINKNEDVFVGLKNHIEHNSSKGKLVKKWEDLSKSAYITSIAISDSAVFVADAGNKIVHHYDLTGKLINEIGKKDKAKGIPGFFIPSPYFDVLVDKNQQLWAVNTGYHAFEAYTFSGELITRWAKVSMRFDGFSGCCNPTHAALLSDGSFVTSEKGLVRVKIHSQNGDFKCVVAGTERFKEGTTGLDLAVDSKDQIYIVDPIRNTVRIFSKID